jgi:hypothetical protein
MLIIFKDMCGPVVRPGLKFPFCLPGTKQEWCFDGIAICPQCTIKKGNVPDILHHYILKHHSCANRCLYKCNACPSMHAGKNGYFVKTFNENA